jgi:hypothetical protein
MIIMKIIISPGKFLDTKLNYATTTSIHTLSNFLYIYHIFNERCTGWATDSVVKFIKKYDNNNNNNNNNNYNNDINLEL